MFVSVFDFNWFKREYTTKGLLIVVAYASLLIELSESLRAIDLLDELVRKWSDRIIMSSPPLIRC